MKKICVWLIQIAILLCVLTISVFAGNTPYAGYIVKLTDDSPRLFSFAPNPAGIIVVDSLAEAEAIPQAYVEYIEPNYIVELFDNMENPEAAWAPNDTWYAQYQQPLQTLDGLAFYRAGITGAGVKVGFVDSGINASHEDLNQANLSGVNFHSDGLAYSQDNYGHGTFAAGILAAQTDNGVGLSGMAPDVQIRAYRAFSTKSTTMDCVVNAIERAVADGCQVINLSLGLAAESSALEAAVTKAVEAGVVVVAAAGNSGTEELQYPAAYEGVIGVGSVALKNGEFEVSDFSQRNWSVFVTAPGEAIAGIGYTGDDSYRLDLLSSGNSGTSYAAPVVSALAALALDYDADITAEGVRYLLRATADDKGQGGYDTDYGYGVVNPAAYLAELQREFEINYQLNGGQMHGWSPASYNVTDETIVLSFIPVREGYLFRGWYTDEACTQQITEIPAGSLGDRMLYASWLKTPCFVGMTDWGQVRIDTEQDMEDVLLLRADYDADGKMRTCSMIAIDLQAGENLFEAGTAGKESTCTTFFLLDRTGLPITTGMTVPSA